MEPMTALLLSLFLTGGSAGMNALAAGQDKRARADALEAENARQRDLERQAKLRNDESRQRYDDIQGDQTEKKSDLTDYFVEAPQAAPQAAGEANVSAANVMPSATNDIVMREIDKQGDRADAFGSQQGAALAELRSFDQALGDASRMQGRDAGYVGQINSFRNGSAAVLPYELEEANKAGDNLRLFGDILGLAGSAVAPMGGGSPAGGLGDILGAAGSSLPAWMTSGGNRGVSAPPRRPQNLAGRL